MLFSWLFIYNSFTANFQYRRFPIPAELGGRLYIQNFKSLRGKWPGAMATVVYFC